MIWQTLISPRSPCGARVADMGVVLPYDNARRLSFPGKKINEMLERVRHVPVAQVPRGFAPVEHRAIILFGVLYQACILFCKKEFVCRYPSVAV